MADIPLPVIGACVSLAIATFVIAAMIVARILDFIRNYL